MHHGFIMRQDDLMPRLREAYSSMRKPHQTEKAATAEEGEWPGDGIGTTQRDSKTINTGVS